VRLALAGDTMLGRGVADRLAEALFADEVVGAARAPDLCIVNLECCISDRGRPVPGRVFHFRAPPNAVQALGRLGVDCVTLANNHALDFGERALLDTFEHLERAGIRWVGAGADVHEARAPVTLEAGGERLRVVALSDHPAEYAAGDERPGIAFADLQTETDPPAWLPQAIRGEGVGGGSDPAAGVAAGAAPVLVSPHWGPNMTAEPVPHVRRAADALLDAGAALVAGHSAHVFHGVAGRVLYDLGDFVDDYRVDPVLRNDLGLLWLVDLERGAPVRVEALPLKLDYCHTRVATGDDNGWIARRMIEACRELGAEAREEGGRVIIHPSSSGGSAFGPSG
jgi:poly-gamma-glutamate capsule biosynthesis protein CapA/YwtB (metallophosphatase superfamily)